MSPVFPRFRASCVVRHSILVAAALVAQTGYGFAQQAIILLRHAEQTPVGAMMDGDPPLNEAGLQRAQALKAALNGAGVTAIVTSQYARSQQTADPLAKELGLKARTLAKDDLAALTAALRTEHPEDTVLLVAHSDTIPALLKLWGHKQPVEVGKTEFNSLWFVVPRDGQAPLVARLKL